MREEDLIKEAQEIQRELQGAEHDVKKTKNPILIILGFVVALLLIMMIVPQYSIKLDPSPKEIISLEELNVNLEAEHHNYTLSNYESYRYLYNPSDVKIIADKIASYSCKNKKVCQAKAIFYFVRDNFDYISDPTYSEYVKTSTESLAVGGGDCDDASVLLINLLGAVGIKPMLVFIPGHVYVQAYIPEALSKYQTDGWVNLDATCEYCKFGEIPRKNEDKVKVIIEL